jgi:hypothetical protein
MEKTEKFSLVQRSQETLKSYLSGPLSGYFLSKEHVFGLAKQKKEIHREMRKSMSLLAIFTVILAFFDSVVGSQLSFLGFQFPVKPEFSAAICVLVSAGFLATTMKFVDSLIIDRYIFTVGAHANMYSFELYLLPEISINLWNQPLIPKFYGPKSGWAHSFALNLLAFLMLIIAVLFALFPTVVALNVVLDTLYKPEASVGEKTLAVISLLMLTIAWIFVVLFSVKFKFYKSEFDEATGAPTEEFLSQLDGRNANARPEQTG